MAKRKRYPKLPNGFGTIRYLGKGRRKPYAVHPPTNDLSKRQPALCYVNDWYTGFAILNAYKAGTYYDGMEKDIKLDSDNIGDINETVNRILNDYSRITQKISGREDKELTFKEVYEKFYYDKFDSPTSRKYAQDTRDGATKAFNNCKALHDQIFRNLRYDDLQNVIDTCPLGHSSLNLISGLFKQMYTFAMRHELCDKDYGQYVVIKQKKATKHGVPFTEDDLKILWKDKENEIVELILIMCYSGHRIGELKVASVDLDTRAFYGGNKSASGKTKVVPVHSAIFPMIEKRINKYGCILPKTITWFRINMKKTLNDLGIEDHKVHDCRHTFATLANEAGINLYDIKRLMGHSIKDLTEKTYVHRTLDELRNEIERIKVPDCD